MGYFWNQTTLPHNKAIDLNAVHLKLDHAQLSIDTDEIHNQLYQITAIFEVFYPNVNIADLLLLTLDEVDEQLNQMRLFLVYFALPGLLIGAYITKYSIDLTIKERRKEIGLLRSSTSTTKQIATAMGVESFLISIIGMFLGLVSGYGASFLISNSVNGGGGIIEISFTSLGISLSIGFLIVGIATFFSTKQLLSTSVSQAIKTNSVQKPALWRRIYLDFIFIGISIITIVLSYLDFDPISGFSSALYDFIAPILAWLGLALLMVRGLSKILEKLQKPLIKVYRFFFKDLSKIITKNILHRSEEISRITILLSLTLSFGLVVSIINSTYEAGALNDAQYQTGADLRIMFPDTGYLDYNTSDFVTSLESEFSQQINGTTSIYNSGAQLGKTGLIIIGIEPETFFDVANIEDSFLQVGSLEQTKEVLLDDSSGNFNNIIFSNTLANPSYNQESSKGGGRGVKRDQDDGSTQVYEINNSYPIRLGSESSTITIADIAYHFPAIADITGRADSELTYIVSNVEFLKTPISNSNFSLLNDENATLSLINVNVGYSSEELKDLIYEWYSEYYPNSALISIVSVEDKIEEYLPLMTSLTGLTTMEFILVLVVSSLGLEIFVVSSLYDRKKEFGTYFAIGASKRDVGRIVFGELILISGFSLVSGIFLAGLISYMYLGFISNLLILSAVSLSVPIISGIILIFLVMFATLLAIIFSNGKLAKLDPVNILRAV